MPNRFSAASIITLPVTGRADTIYAMATVPEAFAIAVEHHRSGRLQAAEQIYRQILQADPTHANSWHLLGVLSAESGNHQLAVDCINRALFLRPDWAEAHANLGNVLREQGKLDEAVCSLERALELKPRPARSAQQPWQRVKRSGEAWQSDRLLPSGIGAETGLCRGTQ